MTDLITTRMGSGERVEMSPSEIKEDLDVGTKDAAQKGEIPKLSPEELDQVYEIIAESGRIVSVPPGCEVIVTDDGVSENLKRGETDGGSGIHSMGRTTALMAYERGVAADTASLGHEDYSFKPVKGVIELEMQTYYEASQSLTVPLFYGSQPNLGLYFHSDGPFPNPAELMLKGKIKEAMESQEAAAEALKADMVFIGGKLNDVGCDGLNFDTAGSSGDPDFWATLEAVRELKSAYPHISIEVGMASEFVLGMHGEVCFDGERLAGMYPHKQLQAVEAAGADIFGVAVNVNTKKSFPWNLARAVTFVKETTRQAHIPVHPNVGMGVCGIPMMVESPIDCVTRASKALALIGKADGLQLGVGDVFGMSTAHIMGSGMGGIRTSGDLVAWMQMTRRMKITEAKKYVAEKLGISIRDLTDEDVMYPLREELGIGQVTAKTGAAYGIVAKYRIAKLLGIEINSVNRFKKQLGLK